jgi:TPP-dependent pyruvate/acetoin dehydrogenase alpha subunit
MTPTTPTVTEAAVAAARAGLTGPAGRAGTSEHGGAGSQPAAPIDAGRARELFRSLLRIRLVEERIAALYAEQQMRCPCHLSIGQEAVAAGAVAALRPSDPLFGTYRSHGIYLAKGGDLTALLAELYGKATGCTRGRGGSMQLIAPEAGLVCTSAIVGGTIPMAVGAALSAQVRGTDDVAMVLFGDGATEEGVFHESLNFAALKRLPVVFVCENNLYACYSHQRQRQPLDNIAERAAAYGLPGARLDGNDLLGVYASTDAAVRRARSGHGPTLLEYRTYRWLEHVGPADDTGLGYRSVEEVAQWKAGCPVRRATAQWIERGWLTSAELEALTGEIVCELDAAIATAQAAPFPHPSELAVGVYA